MRPQILAVVGLFASLCAPATSAQEIVPVDVAFNGGAPDGPSIPGALSADGRFAVFASDASNLVPGDTVLPDVFVRDLELGTTTRITANNAAVSFQPPVISADGNVVGWTAGLSPQRNAFAFDRTTATTFPLATSLFDVVLWGLDADGSFAVVTARVAADDSAPMEVYRVDVASGSLVLCSRFPNGNPLGDMFGHLLSPRIDGSGDRVVFATARQGLVPGDADLTPDVYAFDVGTSTMTRVSVRSDGTGGGGAGVPAISVDGRIVGFNGVGAYEPNDTNGVVDTYVRDLENLTTTRASLTSAQTEYTTDNRDAAISPEGTHVAFTLQVPTGGFPTVRFETRVRTLESGITRSVDFGGAPPPETLKPVSMSSSATRVLALQRAVPGGQTRAVVIEFGPPCSVSNYCTSLPNSTGEPASIGAQGEASLEANSLVVAAVGLPRSTMTVLLMGESPIDPGVPFGHGLLCVGGFLRRMGSQPATDGVIIAAQDLDDPRYASVEPGDTRYFQLWYRDAAAPGGGFNTTDAIAVTFCW
jgi:hypothetical protein